MGKVIVGATVSVDGLIADRNDGVGALFDWYFLGEEELQPPPHNYRPQGGYRPAGASAALLRQTWPRIGATVIGRRLFDLTDGWTGKPAVGDQVFVVTHRDAGDWTSRYPDAPYTFVGALAEAIAAAKDPSRADHPPALHRQRATDWWWLNTWSGSYAAFTRCSRG